jgi:hypothetical protein
MKRKWQIGAALAATLLLISLAACPFSGGPVRGVVVDDATKQPLANAIVVVRWFGDWTKIVGESSGVCYHVEAARTDAQGRYEISAWTRAPSIRDFRFSFSGKDIKAFKPGYVMLPPAEMLSHDIGMKKFGGSTQEYFDLVLSNINWGCPQRGSSGKNLYRLYVALAADAQSKATTRDQQGYASFLLLMAEDSLVDHSRPTTYRGGRLVNTNPADTFKMEEVPQ